nr:unnamed protein product [Callosobruchus chinensis]
MGTYLRCAICGLKIPVDSHCMCPLGDHFIQEHPEAGVNFYTNDKEIKEIARKEMDIQERKSCSRANCPEYNNRSSNELNKDAHAFRTTVESWNSSTLKVRCPKCNVTDKPCIRKQKNKLATSPVGAFFMNTCWPICFMPFLMPHSSTLDLYCKHCGFFMGEYNRATGKLLCRCKTEGKKLPRMPFKVE